MSKLVTLTVDAVEKQLTISGQIVRTDCRQWADAIRVAPFVGYRDLGLSLPLGIAIERTRAQVAGGKQVASGVNGLADFLQYTAAGNCRANVHALAERRNKRILLRKPARIEASAQREGADFPVECVAAAVAGIDVDLEARIDELRDGLAGQQAVVVGNERPFVGDCLAQHFQLQSYGFEIAIEIGHQVNLVVEACAKLE